MNKQTSEEKLRDALRLSKIVQGLPVKDSPPTCPFNDADGSPTKQEHADAIAEAVVSKLGDMFLREAGKLVWDAIRKLVITGAFAIFAVEQVRNWLLK